MNVIYSLLFMFIKVPSFQIYKLDLSLMLEKSVFLPITNFKMQKTIRKLAALIINNFVSK